MSCPLDYAGPPVVAPAPVVTPGQRRRRIVIAVAIALCFIPYPTQVFPALNLRFVDPAGNSYDFSHPVRWRGITNVEALDGVARLSPNAPLSLPARRVWASPVSRTLALLGGFLPHNGWASTSGDVYFELADDEALAGTTGTAPSNGLQAGDTIRLVPAEESKMAVVVSFDHPGGAARSFTIVLRSTRSLPAATPSGPAR